MQYDLIALNCRYSHSCLSLFYLNRALRKWIPGCRIRINQFTINEPYYHILLHLTALDSEAIFFSVYLWNSGIIGKLIKDLYLVKPNLPIILGGPQALHLDGETLPPNCSTVRGPVEGLSLTFYQDLQAKKTADHYEAGKETYFPFPYTDQDFSEGLVNRNIYYESSRGCPFSCSYCLSAEGEGVHTKDITEVKKELAEIMGHRPGVVRFVDRTFNFSAPRSLEIWHYLKSRGEKTVFHFEIAPDLFTEDMFLFLETVRPGRFQFEIGLQSTNPETLKAINRVTDTEKSLETIKRLAANNNIHLHVDLILGLPSDNCDTFRRSFNQVFQSCPHYIQMGLLKVLPQTPIRDQAEELGLTYRQEPPYQILSTRWLSHQELGRLYWFGQCVEAFYNNRYFVSFFSYLRKREEGFDFFQNLLDLCRAENFFRLAGTQEFMTTLLCKLTEQREDRRIIREILRYDWLRTGKRFLPEPLASVDLQAAKKRMRGTLPHDYPPFYTRKTRNIFFKQSTFSPFSTKAMQELGIPPGREKTVCFLPEQEDTVKRLQRTAAF
ncbi:MAG: DUF4080 domain-containing protein [Desulfurivibrionaceae bacterium]